MSDALPVLEGHHRRKQATTTGVSRLGFVLDRLLGHRHHQASAFVSAAVAAQARPIGLPAIERLKARQTGGDGSPATVGQMRVGLLQPDQGISNVAGLALNVAVAGQLPGLQLMALVGNQQSAALFPVLGATGPE
jgi:hypothetical protein